MQHCTQEMKTKLLTANSWTSTSTSQDGIALLKTICDICHKKDGGTDATTILDLVKMDKDMYLIHQAPNELLSNYLSKFKGALDVAKSSKGSPWSYPVATKIVIQDLFLTSNHGQAKSINPSKYQVAMAEAHFGYLAALFFHGLSNESHCELKKKVHNYALTGLYTVPRTYDKVLQLADQYKSLYQPRPTGGGGGSVAFSQKGKAGDSTPTSTPLVASAKKSLEHKPHPVPGQKDANVKMKANALGKKICFNCGAADYWVVDCPNLTAAQCKELAGMAHISVSEDILDDIGFLQSKSTNSAVVATCKTLNPHRLSWTAHLASIRYSPRSTSTTSTWRVLPSMPTATQEQILPPRKDGTKTFSTFGLSATASPISYPSPNWKATVSPSVTTPEANGSSLPPKTKISPSTVNQTACALAFPTSTCGPHWPWQWFKPSASATKASQNARYASP